jgi:NAD-dependent deacetylase
MKTGAPGEFAPIPVSRDMRVFVLTGAGISAESGIPTFRDAGGLWEKYRVEQVASPEGWHEDAELVWRFYSERRARACGVAPNPAHKALAALEAHLGDALFLCTQNVDPLHERAGSLRVCHMHGELFRSRCEHGCGAPFHDEGEYRSAEQIPRCKTCGARIRPHICWFGETPFEMDRIVEELGLADIFVTVGSSGSVYPAAGFVRAVRQRGRAVKAIYVGIEAPENARAFDECRLGKAGEVLPSLFALVP